jgi:hypothetical protein
MPIEIVTGMTIYCVQYSFQNEIKGIWRDHEAHCQIQHQIDSEAQNDD